MIFTAGADFFCAIVYNMCSGSVLPYHNMKNTLARWWAQLKQFSAQAVQKIRACFDFKKRRRALYEEWDQQAQQGNEEACYKLMTLYLDETPEYYPLAFHWTEHVATHHADCAAMLQLAQMYEKGHGTSRHLSKALTWYEACLSMHVIRGKNSPLSLEAANFVQERILVLRRERKFENTSLN